METLRVVSGDRATEFIDSLSDIAVDLGRYLVEFCSAFGMRRVALERARSSSVAAMTTRTCVITGASRGFGRAIAEAALAAGNNVVAAVRRPASVSDLAEQYPQACLTTNFDARDAAAGGPMWPRARTSSVLPASVRSG